MEEIHKISSFHVEGNILVSVDVIIKNGDGQDSGNRRLWKVRLNSNIKTREGSIPVKLASESHAAEDLNSFLKPLFRIECIHSFGSETEVELQCLNNPTTGFIHNGGVPDLLQKIIERDAVLRIFPARFISEIILKAVVRLQHFDEGQASKLAQESSSCGIQIGNECNLTLCPKTTSYCHQVGDGNTIIINILHPEDSNISIYPEGKVVVKVSSKEKGWVEMEDEIVLNSDTCITAINKELEKYNIKLISIQRGCILFAIQILLEKDRRKISKEDGPVLNLFRAILDAGYWIEAIRRITEKGSFPTFEADVLFSLPEDWLNSSELLAHCHLNDEKEIRMFYVGDENQCKVYVTFGKTLMENLHQITKQSTSVGIRIIPTVIEPKGASFSTVEDRLDEVDLSKINIILGKYNVQLMCLRKGSLILDFLLNTSVKEDIFIQAIEEVLHEIFRNVKDLLESFRVVELTLNVLSFVLTKAPEKDSSPLEYVLYPACKIKEAVETGVLPDVVRTLLTEYNPKHLKYVKTFDVNVSFPKEDRGSRSCQLTSFLRNEMVKFVETKCSKDISRALDKEKIVTIVGDPGTGKTTIAYKLILDAIASGYDAQILCSPEEWETKIDLHKKQIILLDDFLGHNFLCFCKADGFLSILPRIRRYVAQRNGCLKVIIVSRKNVLCVGFQYLKLNAVVVAALNRVQIDQISLTETEKKEILHRHLPREHHTGESLEFNTGHFQQCVQLFSKVSSTESLSKFMQNPIENLVAHIKEMKKESKLDFMCLLILALHGGEILVDKLFDINVLKTNKYLLEAVCDVSYDKDKIRNKLRHHKSGYVSVCCSRFGFSHIFVFKAMLRTIESLMAMDLGHLFISHVPLDFLERHVTSKSSPCSELKICVNIETDPYIAKRFVEEVIQGNVKRIARHDLFNDEKFMSSFIEECRRHPKALVTCERDNQNRNLFAGSILYWIAAESSTKCLLQILNANLFLDEKDKFWLKLQTSASLIQACYKGMSVCVVEKLVLMGADLNCAMNLTDAYKHFNCDQCTLYDKNGMTALSAVLSSNADDNRNEIITYLLDRDLSNFLNIPDVLSMVVKNNYSDDVLRALMIKISRSEKLSDKFKLETSLEKSSTSPLWVTAECRKLEAFSILVEFGFRTDISNDEGETLYSKCPESLRKLFFKEDESRKPKSVHPSPEEIRKSISEELFPMASEYIFPFKKDLALKGSVKSLEVSQQKSCFASLRSDIGSDQNEDSQCFTVFEILKKRPKGNIFVEFEKKLLACTDIRAADKEGNTLLLIACGESYIDFENPAVKPDIIKLLLAKGSSMDDHNNNGENVYHRILRSCHMQKVGILLKLIDERESVHLLSEVDNLGFTPFHLLCDVDYKYDEITLELAVRCLTKMVGFNAKHKSLMSIACSRNFNTVQQLLKLGYVVTERDLQELVLIFKVAPFDAHFLSGSNVLLSRLNLDEKKKFKSWIKTRCFLGRHYSILFQASEIENEEKRHHFRNIIESDCSAPVCIKAITVLLRDTILRGLLDECGRSFLMNLFEYFNAKGRGILEIVKLLLKKADHLNIVDETGHGVLYYCINSSVSEDIIIQCLKVLRENKVKEMDRDYILLAAARRFMTDTVGYLVNNGVCINQRDGKRRNALHHVIMSNYVSHHLRVKFEPLVRQLIFHGIDVNCRDCEGLTPIQYLVGMQSCESDDITKDELIKTGLKFQSHCDYHAGYDHFVRYLVNNGANYEVVNKEGQSLLHLVTNKMNKDSYKTVIYLLDLGLDVNAKSKTGETPLHLIATIPMDDVVWCTGLRLPILRLLIKNGANVNEQDESGQTPLHKVVQHYVEFWKHDKNDCRLMKAHLLMLMADVLICHGGDMNIIDLHGKSVRGILDNSDVPFLKMIINQERPQEEILDLVALKLRDPDALQYL